MKEVLTRRLVHLGDKGWDKPDLIIIDGGKGQLSSVMQIVKELGVTGIDFVSLAKDKKKFFYQTNLNLFFFLENLVPYSLFKE